jgi:hypothetical protein
VSVTAHPGFNQAWIHVSGEFVPEGQPTADAHWLTSSAAIGDVVQIRLIESDKPTIPSIGRSDLEATPVPTDGIPFVCGFCGKEPKDVESTLSGRKAMICRGCLRELHVIDCEDANETREDSFILRRSSGRISQLAHDDPLPLRAMDDSSGYRSLRADFPAISGEFEGTGTLSFS